MKHKTLSFLFLLYCSVSFSQITSTFDTDADGWTFMDSATPQTVNHNASNGNPGGYVSVTYSSSVSTTTESWFAPAKFLGNLVVRSLGQNFKFDLQQSFAGTGSNPGIAEIRIESGGNVLIYQLPVKPAVAPLWASYTIKLDETGGWLWSSTSGSLATRTQIIQILSNVTSIEIRGSYGTNASYTSGLDNVIIEQRTLGIAPTIGSISALSENPGSSITIQGSGFGSTSSENEVYFGSMAGEITTASSTSLTVTVPVGAAYDKITIINKETGLSQQSLQPFHPTFDGGGRIIPASLKPKIDILLDATAGNSLRGLAVADVDGDGWNDLLVAESSINSVSVYRNLGTGGELATTSFASKVSFSGAGNGGGLHIIDLDGDGKLDIATERTTSSPTQFATFRNTSTPGNLSFEPVELWAGLVYSGSLSAIEDVDGDGRMELIGQHGSGSVFLDFWIAQNISSPGNIEFGASVSYFGGSTLDAGAGVSTGDLDNDGKPEIIVKHGFGNQFQIIKNNSTPGTISLGTPFPIPTSSGGDILVADFNLDGKNDLAWKRGSNNDDVHIRLNTNNGSPLAATDFETTVILDSELFNYGAISIGDINGDGKPDILASDSRQIGVFENNFDGGAFTASSFIPSYIVEGSGVSTYPTGIIPADLNGDMKPDLVVGITNTNPIRILLYENINIHAPVISVNTVSPLKGEIGSTVTITGSNFSPILSENKVRFGAVETEVLSATPTQLTVRVPAGSTYGSVSVTKSELTSRYRLPFNTTFGPGVTFDDTHFAPPVNFTLTNANYDIEVGDLNLDGKRDILAEANGGFVFRNTHTSGSISTASLLADDTLSVNSFINPRLEDFDGDGYLDVVSVNGIAHKNSSTLTEISHMAAVTIGLGGSTLDMSDFNNDGKMDIAVTVDLSGAGDLVIRENRTISSSANFSVGAYGSFSQNIVFNKPAAGGGVVTEDFDGDGFADVATTNAFTDNISIYRNRGVLKVSTTQFDTRIDIAVGDNPGRIYKGDFDSDGKTDLLLYHGTGTTATQLTILHNTSTVGNISFTRIDLTNPSNTTVATISDLDGDGKPEIITTSETGNRFSIFKNMHASGALTSASFAAPFNTTVTAPRGIATGDLNLDGKPEIIITRASNLLVVYENLIPIGPTITINPQPTSVAVCDGETASFTLTATGADNLTYQWQKFDGSVFTNISNTGGYSGATTSTLTINTTGNFGAGDYRCEIKGDLAPDRFSNTVTLTVNAIPIAPIATGASNCVPAAITLTASGGTNGQYRWYDATNVIIAGQTNSTYVTPVINTTTNYSVAINNGSCESTKTSVTATIQPLAKPMLASSRVIIGNSINICDGEDVTLTAPVGFPTYTWSSGASTQQIIVNTNGVYSFTVTDSAGCISPSSDPVTLTVNPFPLADITVNGAQLTASSGDSYQWHHNGNPITGAINQNFEFNVLEYGIYQVDVTDNGCTSTSDDFVYLITAAETQSNGLKFYPNPVEENLFVEFNPPYTIQVIGITGNVVQNIRVESTSHSIDFSVMAKGIYFLNIQNENQTQHLRIVKK